MQKDFFDSIGQTRTSFLGPHVRFRRVQTLVPGGQSVGQAGQFCLVDPLGHERTGEAHHQDARSCYGDKVN